MWRGVESRKECAQVATISAHNDSKIGELVADAMEKVGSEGATSVEEARMETTLDVMEGMQFDRGFLSPYFITDPQKMEAVLEDALILLYERKISSLKGLLPLLEEIVKAHQPLVWPGKCTDAAGGCDMTVETTSRQVVLQPERRSQQVVDFENRLLAKIVGQDEAVKQLVNVYQTMRYGSCSSAFSIRQH